MATLRKASIGIAALTIVPATCVALAAPLASTVHHTSGKTIAVHIQPMITHVGRLRAKPPTTAQCIEQTGQACYGATQIQKAYDEGPLFAKGVEGQGQTIAIVDAFGSPTIRHDAAVFNRAYGLPATNLKIIRPAGKFTWKPNATDEGWAGETTLDVEYAHTIAPRARILLVETPASEEEGRTGFPQIVKAENYVINHHMAGVISQSFGATEQTFANRKALTSLRGAYISAAKHHVSVLTASGDSGATDSTYHEKTMYTLPVTSWPDSDPLVTGVGGTRLTLNASGANTKPAVAWNDSGGGKSVVFTRPAYQNSVRGVVGDRRGVPDVSMSAACNGAVNTYQSFPGAGPGWQPTCGTSEATPLFAGIVALSEQVAHRRLGLLNPALYELSREHAAGLIDITKGNNSQTFRQNGRTYTVHGFPARKGYDLITGVGSVDAAKFVPELARTA